jgi:hypothetical protein
VSGPATPEAVRALVEAALAGLPPGALGPHPAASLVPPRRIACEGFEEGEALDLWIVFEADPVTRRGYKIAWDERSGQFGIVVTGPDRPLLVGWRGGFGEALAGL